MNGLVDQNSFRLTFFNFSVSKVSQTSLRRNQLSLNQTSDVFGETLILLTLLKIMTNSVLA